MIYLPRIAVALAAAMLSSIAADYEIRWGKSVELLGAPAPQLQATNWPQLFPVHAEQGNLLTDLNMPAMLGRYEVVSNVVRFTPQFPFEPGIKYRATYRPEKGTPITSTHEIPVEPTKPSTRVVTIHPGVDTLPENILKFYIQFSGSMSGGRIYEHIHLRDAEGKSVQLPFLEIDEELWNRDMTRLTLFLDPGRIKRGVKPLEEVGPSLQVGNSYSLTIDRSWRDAKGLPLVADFEKKFKVGPADRTSPDPNLWKLSGPRFGKKFPLVVDFKESMDHAISMRVLKVVDPTGFAVAGAINLDPTDSQWSFVPDQPWKRGAYQLIVPTIIEDLAGNNIGKPFDVDLAEGARPMTNSVVNLGFTVK